MHSLTWALDGGEWSASRPDCFTPSTPLDRSLGWPQSQSGHVGEEKDPQLLPGIQPVI
jgi:hypothetical protein